MEMRDSSRLQLKEKEGFRDSIYLDAGGKPTIGYGHLIKSETELKYYERMQPISKRDAEELLTKDINIQDGHIRRYVTVPLTQGQWEALIMFIFNLGVGNFTRSTLLKKLNMKDYQGAANEFTRWVYCNGVKLNGLVTRRQYEKSLFIEPDTPTVE